MTARNLAVVQGGGPTQVFNATLAAIVEAAHGDFSHVYGARSGLLGLAKGEVHDLKKLSAAELKLLRTSPGAVLGSSRAKPMPADLAQLVQTLQRLDVRDLLLIGGNGTMRGAETVSRACSESGYEVRVMGVPKTVDNDIAVTDRCPGFGSAARYIAQSTRDLGMDVRSLPQPISILETMGRSVGWLAAAAAAGKRDATDAPHLVYLPERVFHLDKFLGDLDRVVARQGWAIVVVSEGIRDSKGRYVYQVEDPTQNDPLKRPITGGVAQFLSEAVARNLRMRCRSEKPGLLGRSSMLHASPQDLQDADRVGRAGVRALLAGESGKMVALLPLDAPGDSGCTLVALDEVAEVERPIPAAWTHDAAIPVTDPFFQYVQPLIGELVPYCAPLTPSID